MKDISKIEAWLKASGMTETRLGFLACANGYAVARIRSGNARVETLRQMMEYLDKNPAKAKEKT